MLLVMVAILMLLAMALLMVIIVMTKLVVILILATFMLILIIAVLMTADSVNQGVVHRGATGGSCQSIRWQQEKRAETNCCYQESAFAFHNHPPLNLAIHPKTSQNGKH